ncbi:uncharacterized protein DUF4956 [Lachnotalea glycerini]|uniref:MgtC/SapB family protein n=1 Tax=Lachnotalea glycerini TaxID=1763509 RepID=A0A255IAW3_9FIRM|nr:MgtC/SapB family protein [Lachnotalea glycerini]OYO51558.1 hypothetical protein CG709_19030 [Lachnotalea glycerini]PXV96183.1 uncharacterized protein DUF4956 [Lachnotalea glycerini]RDY30339.1 MgtC/SapB family protein [Lachnotalea glycerini]
MIMAVSTQDVIKNSILKLVPQTIDPLSLVISMIVAVLIGGGIFLAYKKSFTGVVYDHSFNTSLVIMTILVTIIIVTISSNITLSLGMVGALSIVRYRTAVKNPLDLMFMFWSITEGIVIGAGYYYIAVVCFIVVTIAFILLKRIKDGDKTFVLVVNYKNEQKTDEEVRKTVIKNNFKLRSKIVKNDITELTLELVMKTENTNITNELSHIEGVNGVTLVHYRGNYEL